MRFHSGSGNSTPAINRRPQIPSCVNVRT
jgi:hypothetical protein